MVNSAARDGRSGQAAAVGWPIKRLALGTLVRVRNPGHRQAHE
jgi:hypothetical protein